MYLPRKRFDLIRRVPSAGEATRLLRDSLLDRARANASHALRAIALTGDGDAIRFALDNLDAKEPSQVATALEALDSIGDAAIVRRCCRCGSRWRPASQDATIGRPRC